MSTPNTTSRFVPLPGGAGRYIDRNGDEREVCIDVDRGGAIRVIDMGADRTYLVERLHGFDDQRQTARVVADDYRAEIDRYLAGERDDMPTAHPLGLAPVALAEYAPNKPAAQRPGAPLKPRASHSQ